MTGKAAIAGNLSLTQYFWRRMPSPFKSLWLDADVQRAFEERFDAVAETLNEVELIEERVTATFIDGAALKRIMDDAVSDPILCGIVRQQFELCYFSRSPQQMLLEERG